MGTQAFMHFIEQNYHMDRGHIPYDPGLRFFRKQLATVRAKETIKVVRELQDTKIENLVGCCFRTVLGGFCTPYCLSRLSF